MIDFSELDQYFNRVNFSNHYQWHDEVTGVHNIPRVTEIIDRCMDSTALMNWANKIGVNGIIYKDFRKKILETGTKSHKAIEDYIKTGKPVARDGHGLSDHNGKHYLFSASALFINSFKSASET